MPAQYFYYMKEAEHQMGLRLPILCFLVYTCVLNVVRQTIVTGSALCSGLCYGGRNAVCSLVITG